MLTFAYESAIFPEEAILEVSSSVSSSGIAVGTLVSVAIEVTSASVSGSSASTGWAVWLSMMLLKRENGNHF